MAVEEKVQCLNLLAGADLSSDQYKFCYLSAAKTVLRVATSGASSIGSLQNEPAAAGRAAEVAFSGRVKVLAGAAVAAGAKVMSDATGRAVTATDDSQVLGTAVIAGAAAGDVMEVLLSLGGQALLTAEPLRVPANIETAAFTAAVNATWENYDLIAALNAVLATNIVTSRSVHLRGVLEFINAEAVAHQAKFADGDTPDNDDTTNVFTLAAAAGSEFLNIDLITDASGQIKIEVDDITKVTIKFHLKSYSYVQNTATL